MTHNIASISIVRILYEQELFYFSARILADLLGRDRRQIYPLIRQLVRAGLAAEIENGKYLLLGFEPERVLANPLFIACQLVTPGYVSFWSAVHFYSFTEQAPHTVYIATTKRKSLVEYAGHRFRFVKFQPRKLFGYRREQVGGLPVLIANEEKALIDSLSEPEYAGGIVEVAKALGAAIDSIDLDMVLEYANRLDDKTLGSRLGYLLDVFGRRVTPCDEATADSVESAQLIRSASLVKLDPSRPCSGRRNAQWRVDVNVSLEELLAKGIG